MEIINVLSIVICCSIKWVNKLSFYRSKQLRLKVKTAQSLLAFIMSCYGSKFKLCAAMEVAFILALNLTILSKPLPMYGIKNLKNNNN